MTSAVGCVLGDGLPHLRLAIRRARGPTTQGLTQYGLTILSSPGPRVVQSVKYQKNQRKAHVTNIQTHQTQDESNDWSIGTRKNDRHGHRHRPRDRHQHRHDTERTDKNTDTDNLQSARGRVERHVGAIGVERVQGVVDKVKHILLRRLMLGDAPRKLSNCYKQTETVNTHTRRTMLLKHYWERKQKMPRKGKEWSWAQMECALWTDFIEWGAANEEQANKKRRNEHQSKYHRRCLLSFRSDRKMKISASSHSPPLLPRPPLQNETFLPMNEMVLHQHKVDPDSCIVLTIIGCCSPEWVSEWGKEKLLNVCARVCNIVKHIYAKF